MKGSRFTSILPQSGQNVCPLGELMGTLLASSEFWAAIVGALIGGIAGGLATWLVGRDSMAHQQRMADLRSVQGMLDDFTTWLVEALFTPYQGSNDPSFGYQPDEIEMRLQPTIWKADSLFMRLGENELRSLFFEAHRKSTALVLARSHQDRPAMFRLHEIISEEVRSVQRAAAKLMKPTSLRTKWRVFWGYGIRVPLSMIDALEAVLSIKEEIQSLLPYAALYTGKWDDRKTGLAAVMALERLETEFEFFTLNSLARKVGEPTLEEVSPEEIARWMAEWNGKTGEPSQE